MSSSRWANSDSDDDSKSKKTLDSNKVAASTAKAVPTSLAKKSDLPTKGLSNSRWADSDSEDEQSTGSKGFVSVPNPRDSVNKKHHDADADAIAEDFGKRLTLPSRSDTDRHKENCNDTKTDPNSHGESTSKWAQERERNQKARLKKTSNLSWRAELDDDDLFSSKNSRNGDDSGLRGTQQHVMNRNGHGRRDGGWSDRRRNSNENNWNSATRRDHSDSRGTSRWDDISNNRNEATWRDKGDRNWGHQNSDSSLRGNNDSGHGARRDDDRDWGRRDDNSRRQDSFNSANKQSHHGEFTDKKRASTPVNPPTTKTDETVDPDSTSATNNTTTGRSQALEKLMNTKIGHFDWAEEDDF